MFVRDFIHVGQPFEVVAPRFVSDTSWLAPIAEEAAVVARDVALSLGPDHPANGHVGDVRCEIGPVRARAHSILVPMWLLNDGWDSSFPDLTGDLEIAPVGSSRSLLALGATYRRPTREREALQRMERATEAGVRTFLNGIAGYLGHVVPAA